MKFKIFNNYELLFKIRKYSKMNFWKNSKLTEDILAEHNFDDKTDIKSNGVSLPFTRIGANKYSKDFPSHLLTQIKKDPERNSGIGFPF